MAGLIDLEGNIVLKEKRLLTVKPTKNYLTKNIVEMIDSLLDQKNIDIECAGVAVPGLADKDNGVLVYAPFSGIRDYKIGDILTKKLKIPVFIENDANACAHAEMMYGACRGIDDFIWITVSNGVGGALVLDGEVYEGPNGGAGEIGHINVVKDGYRCGCGNRGCLEAHTAGPAIVRRYKEKSHDDSTEITAKEIAELAKGGDMLALDIYKKTGFYLGKAISYAINLLNPDKIILGGGISMDIDLFLLEIKEVVTNTTFRDSNKNLCIEKTALSYDAALKGAAAIANLRIGGHQDE